MGAWKIFEAVVVKGPKGSLYAPLPFDPDAITDGKTGLALIKVELKVLFKQIATGRIKP
jgi:hypothetical protein